MSRMIRWRSSSITFYSVYRMDLPAQLAANVIYVASTIFLVAISFSLVFSTARFFHFAHAGIITVAGYVTFALSRGCGTALPISVILGLLASLGLGWCLERMVYRPMRNGGASPLILLLASLGLYIILQNAIALLFGDDTRMIRGPGIAPTVSIFGARLTDVQIAAIATAVAVLFAKVYLVDKSRVGLSLRAVAADSELAKVSGIQFDRAIGVAFVLGSFLAGVVGVFRALDVGMTPTMGLPMLLLGVVAVVLGGEGKTLGVAIASIVLAFFQQLTGWKLGAHWEETATFVLLLAFLLWRPQGILGKTLRKAVA